MKFWPTYPFFCEGLGNPAREYGTSAYLGSVPIDFSSQKKPVELNFRIYGHFKDFSKKLNGRYLSFCFSPFPFHRKYISYSFKDIRMRLAALYNQLNCCWKRNFEFFLLKFLEPLKVKKKFEFFWFWKALIWIWFFKIPNGGRMVTLNLLWWKLFLNMLWVNIRPFRAEKFNLRIIMKKIEDFQGKQSKFHKRKCMNFLMKRI